MSILSYFSNIALYQTPDGHSHDMPANQPHVLLFSHSVSNTASLSFFRPGAGVGIGVQPRWSACLTCPVSRAAHTLSRLTDHRNQAASAQLEVARSDIAYLIGSQIILIAGKQKKEKGKKKE